MKIADSRCSVGLARSGRRALSAAAEPDALCQPILAPSGQLCAVRAGADLLRWAGRAIQTKAESIDGAQNIVSDTRYDGPGQAIETSQPRYVNENATSFFQYTNPGSGALFNHTTTTYDGLGRPRRITMPDGTWTEHAYGVFGDRTYDDVVDPNRHRVQYRHDALVLQRKVGYGAHCSAAAWLPKRTMDAHCDATVPASLW